MATLNEIVENFEKFGAEYIGSLISLSVHGTIDRGQLAAQVALNPDVPNHWAPEIELPDVLFWKVVQKCRRTTLRTFTVPNPHEINYDTHGGYSVDKIEHDAQAEYPVVCRCHLREKVSKKDLDEAKGKTVKDVDYDDSIIIALRRTSGTPETDKFGQSTFDVVVNTNGIKDENGVIDDEKLAQFVPLIKTVEENFERAMQGLMTSDQIRSHLVDIIVNKSKCYSIFSGIYMAFPEEMKAIAALSDVLSKLNSDIRIANIPIPKFGDDINSPMNQQFKEVSVQFSHEMLKDVRALAEDVDAILERAKDDDGPDVRPSTLKKRVKKVKEYRHNLQKYRARDIITTDTIEATLDAIAKKLTSHLV